MAIVVVAVLGIVLAGFVSEEPDSMPAQRDPLPTRANDPLPIELSLGNEEGAVITPVQARQVVETFWPLRERALVDYDIEMIDVLETGSAREMDNATSLDHLGKREYDVRQNRPYSDVSVDVTEQLSYPAQFLAQVSTTGLFDDVRFVDLMVFTRQDRSSHWRLAFETAYGAADRQHLAIPKVDGSDFALDPPPTREPVHAIPGELGRYWQYWKEHGRAPEGTGWIAGPWTSGRGADIAQDPQDGIDRRCRCLVHKDYVADPQDGLFVFAVRAEPWIDQEQGIWHMVCGTVRIHAQFRSARTGGLMLQDGRRHNWGGWLEPGTYEVVRTTTMRPFCAYVTTGFDSVWVVLAEQGESVRATGS